MNNVHFRDIRGHYYPVRVLLCGMRCVFVFPLARAGTIRSAALMFTVFVFDLGQPAQAVLDVRSP